MFQSLDLSIKTHIRLGYVMCRQDFQKSEVDDDGGGGGVGVGWRGGPGFDLVGGGGGKPWWGQQGGLENNYKGGTKYGDNWGGLWEEEILGEEDGYVVVEKKWYIRHKKKD